MRIVSRLRRRAATIAVLLTVACNLDVAPPSTGNGNLRTPSISARIDTVVWSDASNAVPTSVTSTTPGSYSFLASGRIADGSTVTLIMSMANIRGAGTYPIGVGASVPGATAGIIVSRGGSWSTPLSGTAGTLVLTELTATRMRGTFTMSLAPINNLAGTAPLTVTGGQFDFPVTGAGAGGVVAENAGGTVSATLGSEPFNGALVTGSYTDDGLRVQGTTDKRGILISVTELTAPGTYALSSETPLRYIQVSSGAPLTGEWNSNGPSSSGSITVTSIGASRVKGTFTATLAPVAGTTTTLSVTNGSFDIGR